MLNNLTSLYKNNDPSIPTTVLFVSTDSILPKLLSKVDMSNLEYFFTVRGTVDDKPDKTTLNSVQPNKKNSENITHLV